MSEITIIKPQQMSVSFYRPEGKYNINNRPANIPTNKKWVFVKLARLHQKREILKQSLELKQSK